MAAITKKSIVKTLTDRLNLKDPEFRFEVGHSRISANVISDTFKGMGDHKRQQLVWDALESEFGPDADKRVGLLLAFSRSEWYIDEDQAPAPRKIRKAG